MCHGRGTRRPGRFGCRATFPVGVKTEDVGAALADGVFTITVPAAQAATARGGEGPP
ncbi:Hsp20/alpha crystallin family protein [Streptomyces sp. 142MFCol3.1]|uniref:Hsp20 family protein n=1 Tax=Streptomyces sp. 142MFCol3.1 TaxID=1172179 RepID=UPI0022770E9D|nr:Hsp20/alpha crystallin family protein [Streptomyces sp. 142MFCol3.1]